MHIQRLQFSHFRNMDNCELEPSPGLNLLTGENGSGKTAFLEALYYLGHARSFRTHRLRPLIQEQHPEFLLFCRFQTELEHHQLGIARGGQKSVTRLDGKTLNSNAALARQLPMLLITPESYRLLTEGPKHRRRLMDWTLFHVEQEYHQSWKEYRRILLHRNSLLRIGSSSDLSYWSELLASRAQQLQTYRSAYLQWLSPEFTRHTNRLLGHDVELDITLYPGWNQASPLIELLTEKSAEERRAAYTLYGPHRAELRFSCDGKPVRQVMSRGQIKIVIICLLLAQSCVLRQRTGRHPLLLVDDLPSELDSNHRQRVMSVLNDLDAQVFITATSADQIPSINEKTTLFHVEHGRWSKVL